MVNDNASGWNTTFPFTSRGCILDEPVLHPNERTFNGDRTWHLSENSTILQNPSGSFVNTWVRASAHVAYAIHGQATCLCCVGTRETRTTGPDHSSKPSFSVRYNHKRCWSKEQGLMECYLALNHRPGSMENGSSSLP